MKTPHLVSSLVRTGQVWGGGGGVWVVRGGGRDPAPGVAASCLSRRSDSAPHRKYLSLLRRKIFVELRQRRRGGGSGETRRGVRVSVTSALVLVITGCTQHLVPVSGDPLLSLAAPGPGVWAHCCHIPPSPLPHPTNTLHSTGSLFVSPHSLTWHQGGTRHCSTQPQLSPVSAVSACHLTPHTASGLHSLNGMIVTQR